MNIQLPAVTLRDDSGMRDVRRWLVALCDALEIAFAQIEDAAALPDAYAANAADAGSGAEAGEAKE